jgi:nitrate reductase beta subunit
MYVRQFKQFLRANDKSLEEQGNGHGTVLDWIRACQRAGILRLERDRRGQMRVFPGAALHQTSGVVPPTQPTVDEALSRESTSDSGDIVDMISTLPEEQIVVRAEEPIDQVPVVAKRVRNTAAGTRKRAPRKRAAKK